MKTAIQERIDILGGCIEKCEQCITACQNVTSFCGVEESSEYLGGLDPADTTDCAAHLGVLVKKCSECIQACENASMVATELMRACDDVSCIVVLERIIATCKATIIACEESIEACKRDGDCFKQTEECIHSCGQTAHIIAQALAIVDGKDFEL